MQPDPASAVSGRRPVRVLIVDGHEIFRAACRALLRTEGIDVIVDVTPADDAGFRIARRLASLPDPPAVMLVSSADRCQFGSQLDGYRFVAKADVCAEAIAVTAQARQQARSAT